MPKPLTIAAGKETDGVTLLAYVRYVAHFGLMSDIARLEIEIRGRDSALTQGPTSDTLSQHS
jgi:hypothetical protein